MKKREGPRDPLIKPEDNPAYGSLGGYEVALFDCPWTFQVWSKDRGEGRSAVAHYDVMTLDDIKALPIKSLLAKDAMLYLWATPAQLLDAISVGQAWGLKYVTIAHVWVKLNKNAQKNFAKNGLPPDSDIHWFKSLGHTTRSNVELLLLFRRGKGLKRMNKGVRQPIFAPVGEHSAKPHEAYSRIEQLYGAERKKLEGFARNQRGGWHSIGLEVDGLDIRDAIYCVTNPPTVVVEPPKPVEWYQKTLWDEPAPQSAS